MLLYYGSFMAAFYGCICFLGGTVCLGGALSWCLGVYTWCLGGALSFEGIYTALIRGLGKLQKQVDLLHLRNPEKQRGGSS